MLNGGTGSQNLEKVAKFEYGQCGDLKSNLWLGLSCIVFASVKLLCYISHAS